jgi:hypothetical protein
VASATALAVHPVTGEVVFSGSVGSVIDARLWLVAATGEDKLDLTATLGPLPAGASFVASLSPTGSLNWLRVVRLTKVGPGLLPPKVTAMAADVARGPACYLVVGTFGGDAVRIDDFSLRDRPTDSSEVGTGYFRASLCGSSGTVQALRGFWLNSNGRALPPVLVQPTPADYLYQMMPASVTCGPSWCAILGYAAPLTDDDQRETHGFVHFVSTSDPALGVDAAQMYTMLTGGGGPDGGGGALLETSAMGPGCGTSDGCLYLAGRFNGEATFPLQAMAVPQTVSSSAYPFCKSALDKCKNLIPAFMVVVDMARRLVVDMERVLAVRWSSSYLGAIALARVWDRVPGPAPGGADPRDPYLYDQAAPTATVALALRIATETATSSNTSVALDQVPCQGGDIGRSSSGGTLLLTFNATTRAFTPNRTVVLPDPVFALSQPAMQGQVHLFPGPTAGSLGVKTTAVHRGDTGQITWGTAGIMLPNSTAAAACAMTDTPCSAVYAAAAASGQGSATLAPVNTLRVGAPGTLGTVIFAIIATMVALLVFFSGMFAIREPAPVGLDRIEEELRMTRLLLAERQERIIPL